ncbi:MAG: HU family DNA-binding protein [Dehalococcoidales bacterium]|nr:HU family DNA-binding protein [Dehalococcoidales bacterium]
MNKVDVVSAISAQSGLTLKEANLALNAALDAVSAALARGEDVSLHGFGTFRPRQRAARTVLHPQTKEPLAVAPTRTVTFAPAAGLRKQMAFPDADR